MQQCETDTLSDAGVLVVGYGGLGKLVSSRLQSLGMRIVCALSSQTDELPPRPEVEDEAHDASENAAVGNEEALPSKDTGIPVSLARVSLGKEEREELEKQAKIEIYEKRGLVSARDRTQLSALRDKDDEATEMDTGPELGRDGEHASDKSDTEKVSRESGLWNWCSGKHGEGEDVKAEQQVNEKVVVRKVGPADVVLTDCQGPTLVEGVQANRICDTDSTVATSKDSGEGHTSSGVLMRSLSKAAASTALNATTSAAVAAVSAGGALTASAAGSVTRSVITTTGTVASWGLERVGGAYAGYTVRAAASATGYAASSAVTSAGIMAGTAAGVITRAAISVSGSAVTVASNAWLRALERRRLRLELQAGTAEPLSGKQILPEEYDPLLVSDDEKDVNADDNIKMYSVDALNMFAAAEDIEFIIVCGDEEERLRGALGESELHLMSCRCNEKMAIICVGDAQAVDIELLEALAQLRRTRQTTSHETLKRIPSVLCRSSLDILDHATPSLQPKGEQDTAVAGSSRTLQELCSEMRSTVHIEGIAAPFSTPLSCENESTTWGPRVERQRARKLARMLVKGARCGDMHPGCLSWSEGLFE
eukprot:scaffold771_cov387-Prasinococcus_capsulatus_cf.AAC.24